MAKICADYKQAEELRKHGFCDDAADMFCTEDGGASNFTIYSADGEEHYKRTWSLGALLNMLPVSIEDKHERCTWLLFLTKNKIEYVRDTDLDVAKISAHGDLVDAAVHILCRLSEWAKKDTANKMRALAWRKIESAHELADPFWHESALRLIDKADEIEKLKKYGR